LRHFARAAAVTVLVSVGSFAQVEHGNQDGAELPPTVKSEIAPPRGFDLQVKNFATSDVAGHPISLAVDEQGRVFAAETNRYTVGVKQTRGDAELEDLELQVRDVEHFREILRSQIAKGKYRREPDKSDPSPEYCLHQGLPDEIAVYEDRDGDGVSDVRTVFATGFDDWYSGPGADVFCLNGDVWYTNIPDLWLLRDRDGDGVAGKDERRVAAHGFGAVYSFLGHDLHGLVLGVDGRIYFSVGDRSFAVTTQEGRSFAGKMGAVFRCNRDGSDLELFATGLRNPQDLAFNAHGDLMTGDNNCDKGDSARILRIVEGAEFGWRLPPQRADSGGPWMREFTWKTLDDLAQYRNVANPRELLKDPVRPAWTLPPLFYPVGQGPSGACLVPGAGLPARYDDHFLLTHCAGGGGLIQAFAFADDGAGSKVEDFHIFLEQDRVIGPSDAIFGFDGRLYCTNWGSGWNLNVDASIEVVWHEESQQDPRVAEVKQLVAAGFTQRSDAELTTLLGHFDHRVRLYAQLALVDHGDAGRVALRTTAVAANAPHFARFHAIHGLGQALREKRLAASAEDLAVLNSSLAAKDPHEREAAVIVLGELRDRSAAPALVARLKDDSARVRLQASIALGKVRDPAATPALLDSLRENADQDAFLRHGAVMGLLGCADAATLGALATHEDRSVRLGAVLALRRLASDAITPFLDDPDFQVASEAARAVYDVRIESAYPALARQLDHDPPRFAFDRDNSEAILRRAIAINHRLGAAEHVARVLRFAANAGYPEDKRRFALELIEKWDAPDPKDPVHYDWWPIAERSSGAAAAAYQSAQREGLLARIQDESDGLRERIQRLNNQLLPPLPTAEHLRILGDESGNENVRLDSLRLLVKRSAEEARSGIQAALATGSARLRSDARRELAALDPDAALPEIANALRFGTEREKQSAIDLLPRYFRPIARYVRVDLPGTGRILSLAEVEVFSNGENVARGGKPSASTSDWEGHNEFAIDGDTTGDHSAKPSVTHTSIENDPWFELDLGVDRVVDAIAIWNRTDNGHQKRLNGAVVKVLDAERRELWRAVLEKGPESSERFELGLGAGLEQRAMRMLKPLLRSLGDGSLDPALRLEVLEAARRTGSADVAAEIAAWRSARLGGDVLEEYSVALEGGDVAAGSNVFHYHRVAECLRCHVLGGTGGTVGPSLTGIGARRDRRFILLSIADPQAIVAQGFGKFSAMPAMKDKLTMREMRDVVEFLSTQRDGGAAPSALAAPTDAADHGTDPVGAALIAAPIVCLLAVVFVALRK
jgi:quinoprotein glucose dehydrogenase